MLSLKGTMFRLFLAIMLALAPAFAWAGSMTLLGAGGSTAITFVGLGDTFSTSAIAYYSCARAWNASYASGGGSLCEVQRTSDSTKCTIVAKSTGFADLTTANCSAGTQTIVQFCNATTCGIDKAFNQVSPGTADMLQATAATQPVLTLSSTPNGALPAINCGTGGVLYMASSSTITQAQPMTLSSVYIRSTGTAVGGAFGDGSGASALIGAASGANLAQIAVSSTIIKAATDATWHALSGLANGGASASAINVDGSDSSGSIGTAGYSATTLRLCRAGAQLLGSIAEAAVFGASTTSTNRNNMSANQHDATNGYNF